MASPISPARQAGETTVSPPTSPPTHAQTHSSITQKGMLPSNAPELHQSGNEALQQGDAKKACHMYTLAIDMLTRGLEIDEDGVAGAADLYACNQSTNGELAKLLSNRSLANLRRGDHSAAVEDADACVKADTTIEKGHMRLILALEASGATLQAQYEVCERGLAACPDGPLLRGRKDRLAKAIARQPAQAAIDGAGVPVDTATDCNSAISAIEATRKVADDSTDPRQAMAAADLGAALAVGAHGLEQDAVAAERYLRIGVEGGDISAQRNLGLLLIKDSSRVVDGAQQLAAAAAAGDEEAAAVLLQLQAESKVQEEEARAQLERMADQGDQRAIAMLRELSI